MKWRHNRAILKFRLRRMGIIMLVFFMIINISKTWGEEQKKRDLTLKQKGIVAIVASGLVYYFYQRDKKKFGEPDEKVLPYIGMGLPIVWFFGELWEERRKELPTDKNPPNKEEKGVQGEEKKGEYINISLPSKNPLENI
jgi:hypothetical protein